MPKHEDHKPVDAGGEEVVAPSLGLEPAEAPEPVVVDEPEPDQGDEEGEG